MSKIILARSQIQEGADHAVLLVLHKKLILQQSQELTASFERSYYSHRNPFGNYVTLSYNLAKQIIN